MPNEWIELFDYNKYKATKKNASAITSICSWRNERLLEQIKNVFEAERGTDESELQHGVEEATSSKQRTTSQAWYEKQEKY